MLYTVAQNVVQLQRAILYSANLNLCTNETHFTVHRVLEFSRREACCPVQCKIKLLYR